MTTGTQDNLYAPPQARVDDIVDDTSLELAGRGSRLLAVILDGLMIAGLGILAAVLVPILGKGGGVAVGTVLGIAGLGILIANCVMLHRNGQTIGKKMLGIKVVRTDGSRIGLTRIFFLRFLPVTILGAIPFVGYAVSLLDPLLIFRQSHQCLHDNIADTVVVRI